MEQATLIPVFLEANTKQQLVARMLRNNLQNGMHFKYSTPMKDGKKWVVWYFKDVKQSIIFREFSKEANGNSDGM